MLLLPAPAPRPLLPAAPCFRTREDWLIAFADAVRPYFATMGAPLPRVRMAIAWTGAGVSNRTLGECWTDRVSADGTHEIYISPILSDRWRIADVLTHELCHAAAGIPAGHGPAFGKLARGFGLEGPLTATHGGPLFRRIVGSIIADLGPVPHGAMSVRGGTVTTPGGRMPKPDIITSRGKPQTARMFKAACPSCGYTVRVARKWLAVAIPTCPDTECNHHGRPMATEGV